MQTMRLCLCSAGPLVVAVMLLSPAAEVAAAGAATTPAAVQATSSEAPAPEAPPYQQALDRAVQLHTAGRLTPARRAFEALARQGVPAAAYNLGVMHLEGQLPGANVRQAQHWLETAAAGGFVTAAFVLGQAFETGRLGQPPRPDLVRAHQWYEAAAQAGSVDAQVAVATAFYLGRGAPRSMPDALHWYREAAKAGDVGAQYLVAAMYEHGDGTDVDLRLARYWYDLAARNGDPAAAAKLKALTAPAPPTAAGSAASAGAASR